MEGPAARPGAFRGAGITCPTVNDAGASEKSARYLTSVWTNGRKTGLSGASFQSRSSVEVHMQDPSGPTFRSISAGVPSSKRARTCARRLDATAR